MSPEGQGDRAPTPVAAIPSPPRLPLIGHLHLLPRDRVMQAMTALVLAHGGIVELDFGGRKGVLVASADLAAELCDERRFRKVLGAGLLKVRDFAGDGLFTAFSDEPNWVRAHRVLMPAFGVRAMRGYFPVMLEVAERLIAKWRRLEGRDIAVADDMTRLTLDTISLAGFDYRFDCFESETLHPFLIAMNRGLGEAMAGLTRLPVVKKIPNPWRQRRYAADIKAMFDLVDDVIRERRRHPKDSPDLMNLMLQAVDPATGTTLDDINIRYQIITFMIAGHETTSGLLTFAIYLLLRHPAVLAQAYAEVDRVLPEGRTPEYVDLAQLDVISRVLKETQRLWPTAPAITLGAYEDTVIGGRYPIRKDYPTALLITALHRDPQMWDDPDIFDIDRFLPEREAALHPHAYKPFGSGVRACIGRQFALAEAKLALAMILQQFALSDPYDYRLDIKETLTLKPEGLRIRARPRRPHERSRAAGSAAAEASPAAFRRRARPASGSGALAVFYGSSLGSCREIAEALAERAGDGGFETSVAPLDSLLDAVPEHGVLVAVTATYNGRAPDSAAKLEAALDAGFALPARPDLRVAVMGCGNTQWRDTYQAFPQRIEAMLGASGASAIVERGAADANGDFDGALSGWLAALFATLGETEAPAAAPKLAARLIDARAMRGAMLPENSVAFEVLANRELVRDAAGLWDPAREAPRESVRHIALRLPDGVAYANGDHIAIFARNRPPIVRAAAERLGLDPAQLVVLEGQGRGFRHLPIGKPITVGDLLAEFVELQDPATRGDVRALAQYTACPDTRAQLAALAADETYPAEIAGKRVTLLDLLRRFPALEMPLEAFVAACPAIRPRFYSISSSPLADPREATLTVGALSAPAWSGAGHYRGVASSYLLGVEPGETVLGYIRRPNPPFAPPEDATRPIILIGPGTGIAPFRGFLQERAHLKQAGKSIGPAWLFYGCRHPEHDFFYRDELESWQARGIVRLVTAFSSLDGHPHRFVQDALRGAADEVWPAIEAGAAIYVCGDGRFMAPSVRAALIGMCQDRTGMSHAAASRWLEAKIETGDFKQDVFGG